MSFAMFCSDGTFLRPVEAMPAACLSQEWHSGMIVRQWRVILRNVPVRVSVLFSRPDRLSVAPASRSAVLAASSPPEQTLVHLCRLHTSRGSKRRPAWVGRPTLQPARRPALQIR
jgi:hypothetical protein